jgi:hypothetical protein
MDEGIQADGPKPRRRRGCANALGIAALAGGLIFYALFGVPFDGWDRFNEARFMNRCEDSGAPESFCECKLDRLKADGVSPGEIDERDGYRAGFVCGVQGNL